MHMCYAQQALSVFEWVTMQERCSNHACVVPQPSSTTYAWTDPSNPAAVPIAVTPWFCPDFVTLDYPARVVNGTGAQSSGAFGCSAARLRHLRMQACLHLCDRDT